MKQLFFVAVLFITATSFAQNTTYKAEDEKVNNLVHTKLNVSFNFENSTLNGEAWLTLSPHFYPTNTLVLDAKWFTIEEVKLNKKKASYNYTDNKLTITLDRFYKKNETYSVYIKYIANPEDVAQQGSKSIKDAKGLYFIDPKGTDPNKPTQVWTQGETEASSCWFPTIDSPNQKTTQEIYITVPNNFVTLSNGTLISNTTNTDNTRTDYWKLDQPHAPYLFFMGIGEFSKIEDQWNNIP
ncbi:MAG TPA: hypothetical protein VJ970_05365, partial [Flavobacteriaceae bacterium]|nr:hypothetical protein [Flavobacteriaceae bacterium]